MNKSFLFGSYVGLSEFYLVGGMWGFWQLLHFFLFLCVKRKISRKLEGEMISVGLTAVSHKIRGGARNPVVQSRREGGGGKEGGGGCLWCLSTAFGLLDFCSGYSKNISLLKYFDLDLK